MHGYSAVPTFVSDNSKQGFDVCIRPALTTCDVNVQGLVCCTVVTCIDAKIDIVKGIESETLSI